MMQFGILSSPIQWQICHHFFMERMPCIQQLKEQERRDAST